MAAAADGKNYAVPSSGFWENMFVNKKVLADCNIEVPGPDYTWDQFLADCQTSECKTDLFANIQHVVTGEMTAEEAIASAIALN